MKVHNLKDGTSENHAPVDAREIVAGQPELYSLIDPKADPKVPVETEGEVMARSAREQEAETKRAHAQQQAEQSKLPPDTPAQAARKRAADARKAADQAKADSETPRATSIAPVARTSKVDADAAEKRAKDAEAAADKAEKEEVAANDAARKLSESERKVSAKAAGTPYDAKSGRAVGEQTNVKSTADDDDDDDIEAMTVPELKEHLDKAGIAYETGDLKADLVKKLKKG